VVKDAEQGWFLRINHINKYGTDPHYEKWCIHPKEPLIFLNLQGIPGSTCQLLGYSLESLKVDGTFLAKGFLQPNLQPEVGNDGYDAGAKILTSFFKRELTNFVTPDLRPLGKKIIECCICNGTMEEYLELIPMRM